MYGGCCAEGMRSSPRVFCPLSCRGKCSVTLLNETDILSQYLEKEVRKTCWEKREGSGYCPKRQEEQVDEVQLTDRLSWVLQVHYPRPARPAALLISSLPVSRTAFSIHWSLTLCRRHF